jgi:hypothetical protein
LRECARLVPADSMKRGFTSNYIELVNDAVETLYTLGRSARAFEVAEQARARAFLDRSSPNERSKFPG